MDLIIVKLAFVVTGALGLGLWQIYDINRELKKEDAEDQAKPANKDDKAKSD